MNYDEAERKKILMFPTIATLSAVAESIGLNFVEGADRLLVPWDLHRQLFTFTAHPDPAIVSIAQVRCDISMAKLHDVTEFIESWNSERINPTASFRVTDEGDVSVSFVSHFPIGAGASWEQLSDFMYRSCDVTDMAVTELASTLGSHLIALNDYARTYEDDKALRQTLFRPYDIDGDPTRDLDESTALNLFLDSSEEPALFDDPLTPVTIDGIAEAWREKGIEKMEKHEDFIVTGINNILMAVFIDNGPSLLMRGHWDCDLPESDWLRAFLVANDWNNAPAATRALWVEEEEHLQLRVEYAIPITHGFSADQLSEVIGSATQSILRAIDALSLEITGSSPVRWPDQ
ncbi:hypothetical protein CKALI_07400 [Corynebacterium kalinowskii]|uniref:YbjN domain-containing protein n=1 Tax=Corynebacterium kalinowskii TaxID=2675216 RepID=A0A6B8VB27_9CORY|nr:YbjN domain-containing protein [Corynebacterium kalinowskii]QGU02342.1 hypothetical protein CKALI_07400 [Corynebacterium kalinowskii]